MSDQTLRVSHIAVLLIITTILLLNTSAARAESVTWTNVVGANASGSSLTPTAAGGHAESSQSISSGNGSLVVSAWPSYPDGNYVSFGLTNVPFTGSATEIKYGWRSYGSVANCRFNGDSLNSMIPVSQGDTLEVRFNGTTVEYYQNSTLRWSLPGQTLSYPYRAAATFSASTSPVISSATMTGTGGGSSSGVTWTNVVGANASGSSLTPTAAGGHAESSQSISSGNGSLVVSAWPSYPDGNYVSFGLTNVPFTGSATEIKYGWRSYGSVANCRLNGDSLNNLIDVAQGDTLEVRFNGTTVEYYQNSTLRWSLPGQTLSYPYRAAATFSASTSPVISSATMTGTGGGSSSGVTWTNVVGANASGSSLTPTAAGGHAESSQSISSGNGSLVVSAWPSYPDGNYVSFGLTNVPFTGSATEIKYGWRSYGSAANCRLNGDSLNNLIDVAQGDTLEVRFNGTTVEYYQNSTLRWSLPGQTLSYPYRAAATFSASTSPVISTATMTGTGGGSGPSIKTDRAVYLEPPLPTLPNAGGTFTDPVFGTQIMRVTDATDFPAPGCGTWYSQWPTFNADNSRILIRCGTTGHMKIKAFDPTNFTLGATLRTSPTLPGATTLEWQGATWSRTDPDLIYVHVNYYNQADAKTGMKLYAYRPSQPDSIAFTLIKDFAPQLAPGEPDYLFEMHVDAHDEIFTFMHKRIGENDGDPIYYIVWRKSSDTVLYHIPNTLITFGPKETAGSCVPDKSGRWVSFGYTTDTGPPQNGDPRAKVLDLLTNSWQTIYWTGADDPNSHGDSGTGINAGHGNFSGGFNLRNLSNVHSWTSLFDYKDANGTVDWSNDQHTLLYADDESWVTIGLYDDPELNAFPNLETGAFEDEVMQIAMDGSQRIRRIFHHRSYVQNTSDTNGYWAIPKPTISRDGRFIAFTSNWENSGRYDLFIARIEPAH